jgi:hypothetical protein
MFVSSGWEKLDHLKNEGSVIFFLTGALSQQVKWPSTLCRVNGDKVAIMTTNNGQYRKLVVYANIVLNAGTGNEFRHPALLEYVLHDKEEELALKQFMIDGAHKDFVLRFKFEVVITDYDENGNMVPMVGKNGKAAGRIMASIRAFQIEETKITGLVINPTVAKKASRIVQGAPSID